jgi:hypothetical protein
MPRAICTALALVLLLSAHVRAQEPPTMSTTPDVIASLQPMLDLARPTPEVDDDAPQVVGGCKEPSLPMLHDRLAFGPGETLSYDVTYLGIRAGKIGLHVDEKTHADGTSVFPLRASMRTDGVLSMLGAVDGHMVSWLDASTLLPVRSVNRVVVNQPFSPGPIEAREDAAFAPARLVRGVPEGGEVNTRFVAHGPKANEHLSARVQSNVDVVDVLSVFYYLRSRELVEGASFCFEVFFRRRMWRVEGTVGPTELVHVPLGHRSAVRLDGTLRRIGGKNPPDPRAVQVWLGTDERHEPLRVTTPQGFSNLELVLTTSQPGRRLVSEP